MDTLYHWYMNLYFNHKVPVTCGDYMGVLLISIMLYFLVWMILNSNAAEHLCDNEDEINAFLDKFNLKMYIWSYASDDAPVQMSYGLNSMQGGIGPLKMYRILNKLRKGKITKNQALELYHSKVYKPTKSKWSNI